MMFSKDYARYLVLENLDEGERQTALVLLDSLIAANGSGNWLQPRLWARKVENHWFPIDSQKPVNRLFC